MGQRTAPPRRGRVSHAAAHSAGSELTEIAWLALLPCALATVAIIAFFGPPFGNAFLAPDSKAFWPSISVAPEPAEHGRYVLALLGPLLMATAIAVAAVRSSVRSRGATRAAASAAKWLTCAFLVLCLMAQNNLIFRSYVPPSEPHRYFTIPTLAAAAALSLLLLATLSRISARQLERVMRETPPKRIVSMIVAGALTATWLLVAINSETTIVTAPTVSLIPWDMNEAFAVLDGRTPLVDYHAQYAQLWPFLAAAVMALAGTSVGVWTIVMASLSGLTLLAVFAALRRIVHNNSLGALALYAPFVATSFFNWNNIIPASIYSLWPLRYGGPYLLVWMTVRHIDGAMPRRRWLLFVAGGLVLLNNAEFGVAAFAATFAALVLASPPRSPRATAQLVGSAGAGLIGAALLVSSLTLLRTGAMPHIGLLFEFSRLYGIDGWVLEPMPTMGLHLAMYVTFAAAIVVATVRAAGRAAQPALTGALAWSGVFGLVGAGYYVGRSDSLNLTTLLSPWSFSLVLLFVVVMRSLTSRGWRRPTVPELAVLFGFGLATCSIVQYPLPWSQVRRLRADDGPRPFRQPELTRFVARVTRPGEQVAILAPLGHRVAYDAHVVNIAPYSSVETMPAQEQTQETIELMGRTHVHKAFIGAGTVINQAYAVTEVIDAFKRAGFRQRAVKGGVVELTD